jgi:hypothetical protein
MASKKYIRLIEISKNVVCKLLSELDKLERGEYITSEQIHDVITKEIKNCTEDWGVNESTIRDNITRGLGMNTHQYADGIREILVQKSYTSFIKNIQSRATVDDINYCSIEFARIVNLI